MDRRETNLDCLSSDFGAQEYAWLQRPVKARPANHLGHSRRNAPSDVLRQRAGADCRRTTTRKRLRPCVCVAPDDLAVRASDRKWNRSAGSRRRGQDAFRGLAGSSTSAPSTLRPPARRDHLPPLEPAMNGPPPWGADAGSSGWTLRARRLTERKKDHATPRESPSMAARTVWLRARSGLPPFTHRRVHSTVRRSLDL